PLVRSTALKSDCLPADPQETIAPVAYNLTCTKWVFGNALSLGLSHYHKIVSRTPQQNGVVERRNRTLVEAARTMLIFSKAPLFLWAKAVAIACYTQNRSLIFGALCYPTNDSEDLIKLKAKADIGFFVGYAPNRKGYRIYNKQT
ncbi:retrovirus-related pol polyprotein from transposon TNT 1-94, partial [Tanacetum coccineum]